MQVAIVGIGGYGWGLANRLIDYSKDCDHRLVAAADLGISHMPEKAEKLTKAGLKLYEDTKEMLDDLRGHIQGIYIATGIHTHAALTCQAFTHGLHVHLEKPAAATVQEVDRMDQKRQEAGRVCLVGFQAMHQKDLLQCAGQLGQGLIGQRSSLSCYACWPRKAGYYQRNRWAGQLRLGDHWVLDGPATNALAHQIMNVLVLAGSDTAPAEPTHVRAELYAAGPTPSHDTAAIEIQTRQGPRCVLLLTHRCIEQIHPTVDIRARAGRALWKMHDGYTIQPDARSVIQAPHDDLGPRRMLENFFQAAQANDNDLLRCSLAQARKMTAVIDAAHESSRRIHRIGASHLRPDPQGGDYPSIDNIEKIFARCAEEAALPSDLSSPPCWAQSTEPWPLEGYDRFPVRFTPADN